MIEQIFTFYILELWILVWFQTPDKFVKIWHKRGHLSTGGDTGEYNVEIPSSRSHTIETL